MGPKKIIRVVIDTNVMVSALLFGGEPGRLIPLWKSGKVTPVGCKEMVDEYVRVFAYPKFDLGEDEIAYLLYGEILPYLEVFSIENGPRIVLEDPIEDPSDDMFPHCAAAAKTDAIITADKHLLSITAYKGIPVVTVARFFDKIYSVRRFKE